MRIALGLLLAVSTLAAQDANDTPDAHIAAAKAAAGEIFRICSSFNATGLARRPARSGTGGAGRAAKAARRGRRVRRTDRRGMPNR